MVRKVGIVLLLVLLGFVGNSIAAGVQFVTPGDLKKWMEAKKPMILLDIQKKNDFRKHQFFGALGTFAYPVKTDTDKQRLDPGVEQFKSKGGDVIIIDPVGGASAERAREYLLEKGVPADKVYILEGGIKDWPFKEMLLDVSGGCA